MPGCELRRRCRVCAGTFGRAGLISASLLAVGITATSGCFYTTNAACGQNCCYDAAGCHNGKTCQYGVCVCPAGQLDCGSGTCETATSACGGSLCPLCAAGQSCVVNTDCESGICWDAVCQAEGGGGCADAATDGNLCTLLGGTVGICQSALGGCVACNTASYCGPTCVACSGELPVCGGASVGCVCDPNPAPRGSCNRGSRCGGYACLSCDDTSYCGQECVPCSGNTPMCGGIQSGCVASNCSGQPDFTPCQLATTPDLWYDICVDGVCVSPGTCGNAACNPPGPSFAQADVTPGWLYPDTDQRVCDDASGPIATCPGGVPTDNSACASGGLGGVAFCGQDAQYGWDTYHPQSDRFTVTAGAEPVVTDNVTGLMWQGCAAALGGNACDTGFMGVFLFGQALQYCNNLNWGGYGDWRLPDYYELLSIVDFGRTVPAIDPSAFPSTPTTWFWTSSLIAGSVGYAWLVEFSSGHTCTCGGYGVGALNNVNYARCVRPGP